MTRGAYYQHAKFGRVQIIANHPDDGAWWIFEYWDDDEYFYGADEASALKPENAT